MADYPISGVHLLPYVLSVPVCTQIRAPLRMAEHCFETACWLVAMAASEGEREGEKKRQQGERERDGVQRETSGEYTRGRRRRQGKQDVE